jgi:nucleotide-binding universal stress UspA family protein
VVRIHQVLCPIDLSDASRLALDHAVTLAGWYDAKTTILHIDDAAAGRPARPADAPPPVRSAATIADEIAKFCEPWTSRVDNVAIVLSSGSVIQEIVKLSDSLPADVLIMGTHGRTGFVRLWLGSVSEKVLRAVQCPVLTVPPHPGPPGSDVLYKSILCPIDFSDASLRALEYAFSIAEETMGRLTLMHVVEPLAEMGFKDESASFAVPDYENRLAKHAAARLDALVPEEVRSWCQAEAIVVKGKPHREIVRTATQTGAELIVMGVHGRGVIDVALFGSTTHHVVRTAPCPVLTLRTP